MRGPGHGHVGPEISSFVDCVCTIASSADARFKLCLCVALLVMIASRRLPTLLSACHRRLCSTSPQPEASFSFADFVGLIGISTAFTFGICALEKRYPDTVVSAGSIDKSDAKLVRTNSGPMTRSRIMLTGSD